MIVVADLLWLFRSFYIRRSSVEFRRKRLIARNDRWFAHLHIQNGGSKRIWILTYSWTGNFLLAWADNFPRYTIKLCTGLNNISGPDNFPGYKIKLHRFEQYPKILQLYHQHSKFPPSFKFWSVSAIQKHWEEVKKCILHCS